MPRYFYHLVRSIDDIDPGRSENGKFYNFVVERPRELSFSPTHLTIISFDFENMIPNVTNNINYPGFTGSSNKRVGNNEYALQFYNSSDVLIGSTTVTIPYGHYAIDSLLTALSSRIQLALSAYGSHYGVSISRDAGGTQILFQVTWNSGGAGTAAKTVLLLTDQQKKMLGADSSITLVTNGTFYRTPNTFNLSRYPFINVHSWELMRAIDRVKTGNVYDRAGESYNELVCQVPIGDITFGQKLHFEPAFPLVFNVHTGQNNAWPQAIDITLRNDAGIVLQNNGTFSMLIRYEDHSV